MNDKVNEKTKEEIMPFTLAIQERIFATVLFDKKALENIHDLKPRYFENPILRDMTNLIINFFKKYSKVPEMDEFSEELVNLIENKGKHLPVPEKEYLDTFDEILSLKTSHLKYSKDLFLKFIRFQAFKEAIMESGQKLLGRFDFEGIIKKVNEAASIGSLEDGALRTLSSIEPKDVAWLWESRIPLGEITLLVGDPGVGKSYFSYFLSAQISKGGSWPDAPDKPIESGKVLILSTDEDPNYAIRPRSDAAGADADKITVLEGSHGEKGEIKILNLTRDIYRMEEIFKKNKEYRLWIIDTLTDYLGRLDSNKYSDVRWALIPVLALARKYNVAIVGILHCNKNTSLQVLYRIMGSMGFAAVARSIWIIAKDRD
ncbi:MAG: AAA family ATPase, partial [Candidatus Aminicenantes bacterium]